MQSLTPFLPDRVCPRAAERSRHFVSRLERPDTQMPRTRPQPQALRQGAPPPPRLPGGRDPQHSQHLATAKAEILSFFYMMRAVFTLIFYQCIHYI